ncbi:MAG: ParA family protein [Pseudomonadales bacterium]
MAIVIAVANQKGGVGKTTTSVNLAASLGMMQRRVLLVDLDPQGNATMGSGADKNELTASIYDLLVDGAAAASVIRATSVGYDLIGANADLTGAEIELMPIDRRESRLREALAEVHKNYDFIIIDCPPALGLLTINGLIAAESVLIPVQCEYYALEGLTALLATIERISATHNPSLRVEGMVRTMSDPRNSLSLDVSQQLLEHFGDTVYRTVVPRNVRLAEAPSHVLPALLYDKHSRGTKAYLALAGEVLKKHPEKSKT